MLRRERIVRQHVTRITTQPWHSQRPLRLVLLLVGMALALYGLAVMSMFLTTERAMAAPVTEPATDAQGYLGTGPDLVIKSLTMSPENPSPNSEVDITVVVENQGDTAVASGQQIELHIYIDPSDDPPNATTPHTDRYLHAIGLAAGGTFQYQILGEIVTSSNPKLYAWVDRENKIAESNEENNLFPTPPPPVEPDAYEQDDTCATAKDIAVDGATQDHNLAREEGQFDEDWVKFPVLSGVKYVAEANGTGADAHPRLSLLPSCDTPPSFGGSAVVTFTATADDTYYLKVRHRDNEYGPESDYQLKITSLVKTCNRTLEPNNICGVASDLAVNTTTSTSLAFCEADDIDWMRVPVKAGGSYTLTAENIGELADVQLSVFPSCDQANLASGKQVAFTTSSSGYVYVKAENKQGDVFGAGTEYTLRADGVNGCDEDRYEPDNTLAQAQPLRINGSGQKHTPCPAADVDWVKFDAAADTIYTIETYNLGARADTVLCPYGIDGNNKGPCDDDSGPGRGSRLHIGPVVPGTYYFTIADRDPTIAGEEASYEVRVITGRCQADELETDNSLETAKPITTDGTLQRHNICPANDEDWSSFTANANTDYIISTSETAAEADTMIEIYDAGGVRLALNDDHAPGVTSQIAYRFDTAGTYYLRTRLYNPERYGLGTEYAVSVRAGSPTPTPTAGATPPPQATATPGPPTGVQTLILVNRARLAQLHGEGKTAELMTKIGELANDADVQGEIVRLDRNTEVSAAYATWLADETDVDKANLVADAIRRVVRLILQERTGIQYVVVVGDDRAIPFRRVADGVSLSPERTYTDVDTTHSTGAAIRGNHYLTDDFYVDRQPSQVDGTEVYIPDLAIGRLVETADDMINTINIFLGTPNATVNVQDILVTGYDFVNDVGQENCKDWRKAMNDDTEAVACLIDEPNNHWTKQQLQDHQLRTTDVFQLQSINGHAFHSGQGVASNSSAILRGSEIVSVAGLNYGGGLIYTLGCHSGLNVPPTNTNNPIDLAEAFARTGANYVGNTGFGYGLLHTIGLSEKIMRLYTNQLITNNNTTIGKGLATAKKQYFQQDANFSAFDQKVMQQLVLYGLPMYKITGLASTGTLGDPFPGVDIQIPSGSFGSDVYSKTVSVNFSTAIDEGILSTNTSEDGTYQTLNGYTSGDAGEPIQPLHFASLSGDSAPARSVIIRGGEIQVSTIEDPLIGTPFNEYLDPEEDNLQATGGWHPAVPSTIQTLNGESTLVTQLSQYNADSNEQILYRSLNVDVYYSTSIDERKPEFTVVDALFNDANGRVAVKAGAIDESGMKEVILTYFEDGEAGTTSLKSVNMSFDASAQKWVATFPGSLSSNFYIQAVDNAGNIRTEDNKGNYYRASKAREGEGFTNQIYLPIVTR